MKARRPRKICSISIDAEVWAELQRLSVERDVSIAHFIREGIDLVIRQERRAKAEREREERGAL
jgi:hypothetical protein